MARIDIRHDPPTDVLQKRRKFIRATIFFLVLILFAVCIGVYSFFSGAALAGKLENITVVLFVLFGICFVYSSEKLLGYRRLLPKQQQEVSDLAARYQEIETYCEKVRTLKRNLVVLEYDAMVAHADRHKDKEDERPEYGPAPRPDDDNDNP